MTNWVKVSIIIFLYIFFYFLFRGFLLTPNEGDSIGYHIPIAKSIISGEFLSPNYSVTFKDAPIARLYFPAASELILAMFLILHLPLGWYNLLAWILIFFLGYKLGVSYGLEKKFSIIFAISLCTLNTILRWVDAQTVDLWTAVFFIASLYLLKKPKKSISYFIILGFSLGMLFGTKYTGAPFALILIIFNFRGLIKKLSVFRLIFFTILILIFGVFWYIRNYISIGNPFFPLKFIFFKGTSMYSIAIWKAFLVFPKSMFNSLFLEFRIWAFALLLPLVLIIKPFYNTKIFKEIPVRLILIAFLNFIVFLFLPSAPEVNIHISNFRLAYPVFIPLILSIFLISQSMSRVEELTLISVANMIMIPPITIYPKLVLIYIPIAIIIFRSRLFGKIAR